MSAHMACRGDVAKEMFSGKEPEPKWRSVLKAKTAAVLEFCEA